MTSRRCVGSLALALAIAAVGCSSSDDSSAPTDDAGNDAKAARDAASPPPGDDDADGSVTCAPDDQTSFAPKWHAANVKSSACTKDQVTAYHQCLKDQRTDPNAASCTPFGTGASDAEKACLACMISLDTAPTYGPLVVHNKTTFELNVAGCIALTTNDPEGKGCAGAYQASQACTSDACSANCPVTDAASLTALEDCRTTAAQGTCNAWYMKTSCVNDLVDAGGDVAKCFAGKTSDELFDAIVPLFCVAMPADAGASDSAANDGATPIDGAVNDASGVGSDSAASDAASDADGDGG